jgi:hypothetical protein
MRTKDKDKKQEEDVVCKFPQKEYKTIEGGSKNR